MTHEKLVAGTESPTRYTKIIRNPGAGTKYNRTYQETDYVSRYTKTAAPGISYTPPAPPEPEFTFPLVASKALWNDHNVYAIGETIEVFSATWREGNPETQTYRSRWQHRPTDIDSWTSTSWENHVNQQVKFTKEVTEAGQHRFNSQVRDTSFDPVAQVNNFTTVKTVDPTPTTIGTVTMTVDDVAYEYSEVVPVAINNPVLAVLSHTGDAQPSYKWEARNAYPMLISEQAASTELTFTQVGQAIVMCTVTDNTATDSPITYAFNVLIT